MVLEDFFTLSEMKDGLTTLARVDELVSVMQTSDCIMKYTSDTARQWSTVATILAATGNQDCLDHFIQKDGLQFLNQWLQIAKKCSSNTSDHFVEESISGLLGALEKLPIGKEQLTTCEIGETIKHLLTHNSSNVQEKARTLFDSWNQMEDKDATCQDVNKGGMCFSGDRDDPKLSDDMKLTAEDVCYKSPVCDVSHIIEMAEGSEFKHSKDERSFDDSQLNIKDVKIPTSNQDTYLEFSNQADVNGYQGDVNSSGCSLMSNTCQDTSAITEQSSLCPVEVTTSVGTCNSLVPGDRNLDVKSSDISELKDHNVGDRSLSTCPANDSMMEPGESCDIDVKESESYVGKAASVLVDDHSDMEANTLCISGKPEGLEASFRIKKVFRTVGDSKEHVSKSDLKVKKGGDSVTSCLDEVDGLRSEVELEYGLDDALEVARRVAREVEQEVVDYREPFCNSSSEKTSEGEIMWPSSPESVKGEHDEPMMEKLNEDEMSKEQDLRDGGSSPKAKRLRISNDTKTEPECCKNDLELPISAAVTQETDEKIDNSVCDFDLNEEVYTEEIECSMTINKSISVSAPVPIVAASKGAHVFPTTPLHFEGELGWRGSAATSAFHPASPRRTPDHEKTSFIEESSNGSKQRQNVFEIDLNVAEGDDKAVVDPASSARHVPISSCLHSGDSSVEVSSRRAERLNLDLNRVGDNEDACAISSSDWKVKVQLYNHQTGMHGQSPASSSSSRQMPVRDFDLNDNPSFFDGYGPHDHQYNNDKALYQDTKAYGGFKLGDPIFSIMGSKIDVDRKEFVNRNHSFLSNRLGVESANAASLVKTSDRSGVQPPLTFASLQHPTFGYNGLMMGPTMSFQPQLYGGAPGSVPYMVDSRGSTVIPQMLGSSYAASPSFARPFVMSVMDAPTGSNAAGFVQSGLDLNSGGTSVSTDRREMGTLKQLFAHGPGSLMEEHMKSAGAGMALKRKEPECTWELNMAGYKQEGMWR